MLRALFFSVLFLFSIFDATLANRIDFNRDIRPILSDKCIGCHGADLKEAKAKLQLHTFETATMPLGKNKDRWAIYPGDLSKSEVWTRIMSDDKDELMPPHDSHKTLSSHEKALIKIWIESGAEYEKHWSFKPLSSVQLPKIKKMEWVSNEIDHFVLAKSEASKLSLSKQAKPGILIRRLYLDLTGLPAPLAVMKKFEEAPSVENYERIVQQLLNSPQYAERMALDWLDYARYADTNGYSIDDHRDMWAWRDWVIDAFVKNKPYDEFIIEQIAGDLIPNATIQQKVATGFLRNSMSTHEGGTIAEEYRVAYTKDKVDVVATSVMGLTMKCAQCHDHKYDPISQKEYYQFYAYFNSSTEGGKGGTNGNVKPLVQSTTAYCDESRLKLEMGQRISDLEKTIFESIPNFEEKRLQWESHILNKWKISQKKKHNEVKFIKTSLKPKSAKLNWIWSENPVKNKKVEFKKTFEIETLPSKAYISATCDDSVTVFFNNKKIGKTKDWKKPIYYDVAKLIKRGKNIITAKVENSGALGGFLFQLDINDNTKTIKIQSDSTWLAKAQGNKKFSLAKVIAPYGKAPWGHVFDSLQNMEKLVKLIYKGIDQLTSEERKIFYDAMFKDLKLNNTFSKTVKAEIAVLEKVKKIGMISTMVMDHGERDTFILTRGEYDKPGEKVTPALPAFLPAPTKSEAIPNRLGLAKWLTRKDHPLTSRVMVNRVWQMIMGRGLVETSEDFGSQGSLPVQEELLNYLAYEFVQNDWNIKELVRKIVTSSTYKQSSKASPIQKEMDPKNDLFSRAPRFRLAAEIIRDKTLFHAGLINPKVGGPSVFPDQPDNLWKEISHYGYSGNPFTAQVFLPSKGKDLFRKSMYTFWKRTLSPPNMTIFDAPTRETCSARRLTTNTPLQALVLMNDPQFFDAARHLGKELYLNNTPFQTKLRKTYKSLTGHIPSEDEYLAINKAYDIFYNHYQNNKNEAEILSKTDEDAPKKAAYIMLASTLFNLDEAITRQ